MRLSDAGLRRRPTKLIYPNHRLPPWPTEDATRVRSNRLLVPRNTLSAPFVNGLDGPYQKAPEYRCKYAVDDQKTQRDKYTFPNSRERRF